jgi:hypothetical protein
MGELYYLHISSGMKDAVSDIFFVVKLEMCSF